MRKLLLYLLVIILLVFSVVIVVRGVQTSSFSIESYSAISQKNDELDSLIKEANNQKEINFNKQKLSLESAYKLLQSEKESYQQLLNIGVYKNGIPLSKIQEYEIEKIWITLGRYAEKEGVDLKLDISVNNSVAKTYNLNFTVNGTYSSIEDFLRDIQGDKTLVFKIDEFKLVSGGSLPAGVGKAESESTTSDDILTATFVCKDIKLNIVENTETNNSTENTMSTTGSTTSSTSTQMNNTTASTSTTTSK